MQELQVFKNNGFEIRVVGDSENPLFVAKDVCEALGITNVSDTLSKLDDDEKGVILRSEFPTLENIPNRGLSVITESGLYALIMRSNKKESKLFRKWVTGEVLPSIRKTGSYSKQLTEAEMLLQSAKLLVEQQHKIDVIETKIDVIESKVESISVTGEIAPPVGYRTTDSLSGMYGLSKQVVKDIVRNTKRGKKIRKSECLRILDNGQRVNYTVYNEKDFKKLVKWLYKKAKRATPKQYTCKELFGTTRRFEMRKV